MLQSSPRRILVVSISGLGNTLMFTPALRRLRGLFPSARVDALLEGVASRQVLETNPDVSGIDELGYGRSRFGALLKALGLRRRRYGLSITAFPSNKLRFGLLAGAIGAHQRAAHCYPQCPEPNLGRIHTVQVRAVSGLHDIGQNLRLVEALAGGDRAEEDGPLPRPILHLGAEDRAFCDRWWSRRTLGRPVVGIHPGGGRGAGRAQAAKRWPVGNFAELIRRVVDELSGHVLVFCGPKERPLRRELQEDLRLQSRDGVFFPEGPIRSVAAMIERCDAMVTNDSGLMHVATAVGTPVVALFGPTDCTRTAPPWADCRVLEVASGDSFGYPFATCCSRLEPVPESYWDDLPPRRVLEELAAILSEA